MEFERTRSQIEIVKAAKDFARSEFDRDRILEFDRQCEYPRDVQIKAAELGFTSIHLDVTCLGGGMGHLENALMAEELCRTDSTMGCAIMLSTFGADLLNRFGSKELKSAYLPDLAEGEKLCGTAMTGPGTTCTAGNEMPVAVRQHDIWIIQGRLDSVINGGRAGVYIVPCRTVSDGDTEGSVSVFVVENRSRGITVIDAGPNLGLRMTAMADLEFDKVEVPSENLIGCANDGERMLESLHSDQCVILAALATGTGQGALERAVIYVKQREQFGKKIAAFQVTRHKLAGIALALEQARSLTYRAAWQNDRKKQDAALSGMARLSATTAALASAHEAIQLLGGYGYSTEYEVERFCRDAKTLHLLGESPGSLRDRIADSVIGRIK